MEPSHSVVARNNVTINGSGSTVLMLAHGFGCDQNMWRHLLPYFDEQYTVILFDYVGCGASDYSAYDKDRYSSLNGYAQDVLEICEALSLKDVTFIGHSVSSMIGMHAAIQSPHIFSKLAMICPSPCFLKVGSTGNYSRKFLMFPKSCSLSSPNTNSICTGST